MTNFYSISLLTPVISFNIVPVAAHNGDRVIPIRYLSEETLALLDQDDGIVEDWVDAVGEPVLTPLYFNLWSGFDISYDQHDPASLDFRIWLGWSPDGRIHVAGQFVDDVYVNEYDPTVAPYWFPHVHDSVSLLVDGDHTPTTTLATQRCNPSLGAASRHLWKLVFAAIPFPARTERPGRPVRVPGGC